MNSPWTSYKKVRLHFDFTSSVWQCQITVQRTLYTHNNTGCPVCVFCLFPAATQTVRPSGSSGTAGWEGEKDRKRERPLQSYSNHMQMSRRTPHEKRIINYLAPLGQWEGKALITPSSKREAGRAPRTSWGGAWRGVSHTSYQHAIIFCHT